MSFAEAQEPCSISHDTLVLGVAPIADGPAHFGKHVRSAREVVQVGEIKAVIQQGRIAVEAHVAAAGMFRNAMESKGRFVAANDSYVKRVVAFFLATKIRFWVFLRNSFEDQPEIIVETSVAGCESRSEIEAFGRRVEEEMFRNIGRRSSGQDAFVGRGRQIVV